MRKKTIVSFLAISTLCFGAFAENNYVVGESEAFDLCLRDVDPALLDSAVVHPGGELAANETWAAGSVHVVYGTVVVSTNATLTIEPGAVVKFLGGGIVARGDCIANGATFTDIADGAVDGGHGVTALPMPSYVLKGNFETDDTTRIRFAKNSDEFAADNTSNVFAFTLRMDAEAPEGAVEHGGGTLAADETWSAGSVHVVYGTVIVATNATLTIEPGATVKFLGGGIIARGNCIANGATFTDIADGATGGALPMPSYVLKGNFETDDATRIRFAKNGDEFEAEGVSGAFRLDITDDGYRFAHEKEEIAYSSSWGDGDGVMVAVTSPQGDTVALVDESGTASGVVEWNAPAAPGLYRFTHSSGGENLEAGFIVLDGAVVHGGTLEADETWTKDAVHIIGGNVYVSAGVVLTIEPGAVVKFADGKVLSMSGGGVCIAEGVVFTCLADDTAGGDTLADGGATAPRENSYMILGMVADDAKTEYRCGTVALCGAIGMDTVWRKEKTYVIDGTLTVANGASLTIPPGTVVKFTEGSTLAVENGGECIAKGVVFTHIADDAVGGDTMGDGDATAPEYGKYRVDANIVEDDATEYRYYVPTTLSSSISTDTILRGNRVYIASNDVTVASGVMLTVGPGATIKFAAGKSLRLRNGSCLIVQGTRSRPIVFTSIKDDSRGGDTNGDGDGSIPYPGDWGGVIANGARIEAEYAQFLYGGGVNGNSYGARASCFMWDNASGTFSCCRFSGSPMDGCFAQNATFANCIFDDNDRGLVSHTGTITADNCVAANNRIGFFSHTSPLVVRNCISSLNTGSAITGDGGSRQTVACYFGDDPKFVDPENGDYRIATDSPCVDAGNAAYAPEKDYYGSPRYAMTYGGEAKPDIGIHEVLPKRVASDVDLEAVEISASGETFTVGDSITVKWRVRNVGIAAAQGPWTDTIYAIDASGAVVVLGSRTTQRNLVPGATVECEGTFHIPAMAEGWARIRLTVNSGRDVFEGTLTGNNTTSSATSFNVLIPVLDAGEMMTVQIPAGSSVAFRLPSDSKAKSLLFMCGPYVSAFGASGRMPRRGMEDTVAVALSAQGSDFLVLPVPDGAAKNGFVFVLENTGTSFDRVIGGEQTEAMEVYEVYPKRLAVGEPATLRVRGVGMCDVDRAMLEGAKRQYGRAVQIVSPTEALLTFTLANAEPGTYDLYVEGTNHTFHTYKNAVEIYKPLEGPKLEARIEGPSAVRVGRIVSARIVYSNIGDMPMRAPYFMLSSDNSKFRLDGEEEWQEGYVEVMGLGPGADPSVLAPGETGSVAYEFISLGGARTRLESDADTSDYWANHADAAAAAASRVNRRGRRIVRYSELERYAEEFREHPGTSNAACGVLRDQASGEPLAGVEVCAMSEGGELLSFDTVDANGVFVLEGLPNATNLVLSVVEGAFADDLSVAMPASGDLPGLRWYGTKGWTINVSVEGATEEDFEQGIMISYSDESGGDSGLIVLTNNVGSVCVRNEGLHVLTGKTVSGREESCIVDCENGDWHCSATIDFDCGTSVSGRVVDSHGVPITNAVVVMRYSNALQSSRTVTTDCHGSFSLGCVMDGEYTLQASAYGYASGAARVVSVEGANIDDVLIALVRYENTLSGSLPQSCTNGMVIVNFRSGENSSAISIRDDASFVAEGLPHGNADMRIYDCTGRLVTIKRDVEIGIGANVLDIESLPPDRIVACKAVNEDGEVLDSVWTFMDASSEGMVVGSSTNGYAVARMRDDAYWIRVQSDGYVEYAGYMVVDSDKEAAVALKRGGVAKVQIASDYDADRTSVVFVSGDKTLTAQEISTGCYVCKPYSVGSNVYAFVSYTNEAYYTSSCVLSPVTTGEVSRVATAKALRIRVNSNSSVTAIYLKHLDESGIVSAYSLDNGVLELIDYPAIDLRVQAVADDGAVLAERIISGDERDVELVCNNTICVSGRVTKDGTNVMVGGSVYFCDDGGNVKASGTVSMIGTFAVGSVPESATRVYASLSDGTVFSVTRDQTDSDAWELQMPSELCVVAYPVKDDMGNAVVGLNVQFTDQNGFSVQVKTDSNGIARSIWIAGTKLDVRVPPCSTYTTSIADTIVVGTSKKRTAKRSLLKVNSESDLLLKGWATYNVNPALAADFTEIMDQCPRVDLSGWKMWDWDRKWIGDFHKELGECYRRIDAARKQPDPKYSSCLKRNCTYNAELYRAYVLQKNACLQMYDALFSEKELVNHEWVKAEQLIGSGYALAAGIVGLSSIPVGVSAAIGGTSLTAGKLATLMSIESVLVNVFNNSDNMGTQIFHGIFDSASVMESLAIGVAQNLSAIEKAIAQGVFGTLNSIALVGLDHLVTASDVQKRLNALKEDISKFKQSVEILERLAAEPYHKCGCGCSPECPCGGTCESCKCGGDNGPHPSPRNPHPPYPKPWSEPTSEDPNEVAGPLGIGEHRCVKAGDEMLYMVYFENKSDASAAAQDIYITNPLSEWLDWTTFEMLDVGFNNQIDRGLDGLQSGVSEVALNNTPYFVKSSVALDESSGHVNVELHIIDKTTKYGVPEDPYAGILPPNDATHRGEGHISYRIKVREDAPSNVVITNSASIVFDYNDPIETDPAWWNTVGAPGAAFPESEVEASEGEMATIKIMGGSADAAASVKVYLTYNTAAAADVDLAKGTVDGTTPKGGLKFPLALTWEKGEMGEKVISIPVKTDKTVEDDEFFTLQLAEAEGMELGEERVCTVTIRDTTVAAGKETLQDAVNNAVVKMSTSGKGKWAYAAVGTGGEATPGKTASASAMSPVLKAGEMSELKAAAVKGSGTLTFDVRVANPNLEGESPEAAEGAAKTVLTLLDGKAELLAWTNETDWTSASYTVEEAKATSHAFTWRVVQGADTNAHAYVANVVWSPAGTDMRAITLAAASYVGGEPCDDPFAGGTVSGGGVYPDKTKLSLVATAKVGWEFVGWAHGGGCGATALPGDGDGRAGSPLPAVDGDILSSKAKWQVVVTNDAEYVAVFEKIPYVRGLADPADGGKVSGSGYCAAGKKVTLKATASKNYAFLGWVRDDGHAGRVTLPDDGDGRAGSPLPADENGFVATTPTLVIDRTAKPAADSKTSTTITNVTEDVTYFAVFRSDPKVTVSVEATDENGASLTGKGAGKYVAGTITGEGKYAPRKKVTLKATANKNYVFAGWVRGGRGATALPGDVASQAASLSFEMPSNDVQYVAKFVTAEEDKESIELSVDGAAMEAAGAGRQPYRTNIWCGVYLEWPVAASALSGTKVKVAGLPTGLKFTEKPVTSKIGSGKTAVVVTNILANTIYGAPTAASKAAVDRKTGEIVVNPSAVKITVTTAGKSSQTYQIDTVVDALPAWAQGTFAGGGLSDDGRDGARPSHGNENALAARSSSGVVSLAIAANGKISGKLLEDGLTWTLSAPWFGEAGTRDACPYQDPEDGSPTSEVGSPVFIATVIGKSGKREITNEVTVAEGAVGGIAVGGPRSVAADPDDGGQGLAALPDDGHAGRVTLPEWTAWQYNWKAESWKTLGKSFDKKTVTYAILADGSFTEDEEALTSALGADVTGRVTLKFAASGTVSIAGEFVTGYNEKRAKYTTVKASGSATLVPVDEEHGAVFIYLAPKGLSPHVRSISVPWP